MLTITDGTLGGQTVPFDFSPASGDNWPDYRPYGLKLVPGTNPPQNAVQAVNVDTTNRLITFTLTKGDTVILNLCSTCDTADIPLFGLSSWFNQFDAAAAASGQYWSITPAVQVELVYAVQQPLLTPEFPSLPTPPRAAGDTFAPLEGDAHLQPQEHEHDRSTGELGRSGRRSDPQPPVQGPGAPNPNLRQTTNSPVATVPSATNPLASSGSQLYTATDLFSARHEFYDTKHRNVTYHGVATSQFSRVLSARHEHHEGDGPSGAGRHPVQRAARHAEGRLRGTDLRLAADTAELEDDGQRALALRATSVHRPAVVELGDRRAAGRRHVARRGGGPCHPDPAGSSEVGKRRPPPTGDRRGRWHQFGDPVREAEYVTDWGADPVFGSSALPSLHPRVSTFSNATESGFGLSIEEDAGISVNVAGHPVLFDATRNLWYCDIAINTGATYTPMVRMALARTSPTQSPGSSSRGSS